MTPAARQACSIGSTTTIMVIVTICTVAASQDNESPIEAWWRGEWTASEDGSRFRDISITWAQVQPRPSTRAVTTFVYRDLSSARLSQTFILDGDATYLDQVMGPTYAWELTPRTLYLFSGRRPWPEGHALDQRCGEGMLTASLFLDGGLRVGIARRMARPAICERNGQLTIRGTMSDGGSITWGGTWETANQRGFIRTMDMPGTAYHVAIEGWTWLGGSTMRWVASSIKETGAPRGPVAMALLSAVRQAPAVTYEECKSLTFRSLDMVRGPIGVANVQDFRGDKVSQFAVIGQALIGVASPQSGSDMRFVGLRGLRWAIPLAVVCILVLWVVSDRRRGPPMQGGGCC